MRAAVALRPAVAVQQQRELWAHLRLVALHLDVRLLVAGVAVVVPGQRRVRGAQRGVHLGSCVGVVKAEFHAQLAQAAQRGLHLALAPHLKV